MTFCTLWLIFFGPKFDLIILDQIPFPLPFLCLKYKTLFYCHHPDKVLCVNRNGILKKIYRFFMDLFEEIFLLIPYNLSLLYKKYLKKHTSRPTDIYVIYSIL